MKRFSLLVAIMIPLFVFAEFNRTTSFIDTPVGFLSPQNQLRIGLNGSFSIGTSNQENHPIDFDYLNISYTFLPTLEVAFTAYTMKNYVIAAKYLVYSDSPSGLDISIGVDDITYTGNVSSVGGNDSIGGWDDDLSYPDHPAENLSLYAVLTKRTPQNIVLNIGLGRGRFIGYGPRSQWFHLPFLENPNLLIGFFGSLYQSIGPVSYGFEFDGRDLNIGVKYQMDPFTLGFAFTKVEQFLPGGEWRPRVAFGLTYGIPLTSRKLNTLSLLIVDKKGNPVNSYVSIKDASGKTLYEGPVNGVYELKTEYTGPAKIRIKAKNYEVYNAKIVIPKGKSKGKFTLKPYVLEGTVKVRVFDLQDNRPGNGTIVITDANGKQVINQQVMGKATFKLKQGEYNVKVHPGTKKYYEWSGKFTVKRKQTINLEVGLVRKKFKLVLHKIEFETGKAIIKPAFYPYLDEVAKSIKMAVESNPTLLIEVQGHTDSQGSASYNLKLSQLRAEAVKEYLVTRHGIDPNRLIARGYGETRPIASNRNREGRARNRRVEFVVLQK